MDGAHSSVYGLRLLKSASGSVLGTSSRNLRLPRLQFVRSPPQCRNTQLLNVKRSLRFCLDARDNGIPCALCLSWAHEQDIQRWGEYLAGPGHAIDCVSINVQTSASHAEVMSSRVPEIEKAAGRKLRWLVNGPAASACILLHW